MSHTTCGTTYCMHKNQSRKIGSALHIVDWWDGVAVFSIYVKGQSTSVGDRGKITMIKAPHAETFWNRTKAV